MLKDRLSLDLFSQRLLNKRVGFALKFMNLMNITEHKIVSELC
jgi:hypothetical protein